MEAGVIDGNKGRYFRDTWLFLLYASTITAGLAVIFSSIWWNLWVQLASWSSLTWLGGLTVLLTVPGIVAAKSLLICGAFQIAILFWILYRRSRIPPEQRDAHPAPKKD